MTNGSSDYIAGLSAYCHGPPDQRQKRIRKQVSRKCGFPLWGLPVYHLKSALHVGPDKTEVVEQCQSCLFPSAWAHIRDTFWHTACRLRSSTSAKQAYAMPVRHGTSWSALDLVSSAAHAQIKILAQAVYHESINHANLAQLFCDAGITLKDRSAKVDALGSTSADGIFHSRARATGTRKARSASCGSLDSWMAPRARINTRAGQKHKPRSVANQIPRWAVPRLACILKCFQISWAPRLKASRVKATAPATQLRVCSELGSETGIACAWWQHISDRPKSYMYHTESCNQLVDVGGSATRHQIKCNKQTRQAAMRSICGLLAASILWLCNE